MRRRHLVSEVRVRETGSIGTKKGKANRLGEKKENVVSRGMT